MPITVTADAVTEIPEPLRASAKEVDGKFVLSALPEGFGLDNVAAARGKQTKLEQDLKRAGDRLKSFAKDDKGTIYEAEEFQQLVTDYQRLKAAEGKAPNADELRKSIVAETENRYSGKLTAAEKMAADALAELDHTTLAAVMNEAVAASRPKEGKDEIVRLLLRERLAIEKVDGKRHVRVKAPDGAFLTGNGPDGYTTPKDFALNVLRTQHPDLFAGDGASGAGAGNSGGARKAKYTFAKADLDGKGGEFLALRKRAAAEGLTVELV